MNFFLSEMVGARETLEEADKRCPTPKRLLSLRGITFQVKYTLFIFVLKLISI